MQQAIVPSIYAPRRAPVLTPAFPLVRHRTSAKVTENRPRRFFAGLLFGVLMSLTLMLLGYSARLYWDQNPQLLQSTWDSAQAWVRY